MAGSFAERVFNKNRRSDGPLGYVHVSPVVGGLTDARVWFSHHPVFLAAPGAIPLQIVAFIHETVADDAAGDTPEELTHPHPQKQELRRRRRPTSR